MFFKKNHPEAPDRRQSTRRDGRAFSSCLGEVIDVSPDGMRVFHKGAAPCSVDDTLDAQLQHEGETVHLRARVIWIDKAGLRRWMIGLSFIELTAESRATVERMIARNVGECVGPRLWIAA